MPDTSSLCAAIECKSGNASSHPLMDMAMAHMKGDVLSAKLISLRPDLPIILCTGYSKTITEERAHKIGIRRFLMKPVSLLFFYCRNEMIRLMKE